MHGDVKVYLQRRFHVRVEGDDEVVAPGEEGAHLAEDEEGDEEVGEDGEAAAQARGASELQWHGTERIRALEKIPKSHGVSSKVKSYGVLCVCIKCLS